MKIFSLFFLIEIILIIKVCAVPRKPQNLFRLKNFACTFDNTSMADVRCDYKAMRNKFGVFNYAFTYINPVANYSLDIQSYIKGSSNAYRLGAVHIQQDLCHFDLGPTNLIMQYMAVCRDAFLLIKQNCPYKGRTVVTDFTVDSIDSMMHLPFIPTGDYKLVFKFIDYNKNKIIWEVLFEASYKGTTTRRGI